MNRSSTHLVPLLYTSLAASGVLLAILGGSNTAIVVIGVIVALVFGTTAAVAWRRSGPVDHRISTQGWWKLVVAGVCTIVAVAAAAQFGVEAWVVGMFAVLVGAVLVTIGVLLGIANLVGRHSRRVPA
jgi:hypothetical protein